MNRANVSYRIPMSQWVDDGAFAELMRMLERNREGFDDVALFLGAVHSPLTLDYLAEHNAILRRRYPALRAAGYGAGVNHLCTVGHHDEDLEHAITGFTNFTGADGAPAPGTFCPNWQNYREQYLKPLLTMLAEAGPDFIWLDDDIRFMGHGKAMQVCFCDRCMELFNRANATAFSRAELTARLNAGDAEALRWRSRFLAFNGQSIESLFRFAAETIHAVDPAIEVGAMDAGMRVGDTGDLAVFADALENGSGKIPRWRPGGGSYTEKSLDDFLVKGHQLGAEAAWLPDRVTNIQSEIECFNYQRLRKSRRAIALEACIYNAGGMTGTAWNVFDNLADDFEVYFPLFDDLTAIRPFLDRQVASGGRVRPSGVYNGWTPEWNIVRDTGDGTWTQGAGFGGNPHMQELFAAGLPPAYRLEDARVTCLVGRTADTLDDAALKRILAGGLYCDVATLEILITRGFGEYAGFRPGRKIEFCGRERLLDHPFNAGGQGKIRDCRQSFPWGHEDAWELESLDGTGVALAELVDYREEVLAKCSLGIYENSLGGRVAVAGYYPLRDTGFACKMRQFKNLFRWLSRDTLPGWVDSYHRVAVWAREHTADGKPMAVNLVNCCLDPASGVAVMVHTASRRALLTDMRCAETRLAGVDAGGGYTRFELPATLNAWELYLLEVE